MSLRWARTYAHEENQPSAWTLYEHGAGGRGKRPQDPPKLTVVGFTRKIRSSEQPASKSTDGRDRDGTGKLPGSVANSGKGGG